VDIYTSSTPSASNSGNTQAKPAEKPMILYNEQQDEEDLKMLTKPDQVIFVVERPKCRSPAYCESINRFGQHSGF
jgi:hypothetical protein